MKSLAMKIEQISGLRGTVDINAWEESFITSIVYRLPENNDTRGLSARQLEIIERIWERHFA